MIRNDLTPIDADTFYEGMYIDSNIYFKYRGTYVLLCRKVMLNADLIWKLQELEASQQTIYVEKEHYETIKQQSVQFLDLQNEPAQAPSPEEVEEEEGEEEELEEDRKDDTHLGDLHRKLKAEENYNRLTNSAQSMMRAVQQNDTLPVSLTDALSKRASRKLRTTDTSILIQCINNMRNMEDYLYTHSTNVSILNGLIGKWMKMSREEVDLLVKTGLLHDVGRTKIPPEILNKPAKLTPDEYGIVKRHPVDSYELLVRAGETDERLLGGVRSHHERVNGTGYPDGLRQEQIPLFARITAVSDVYDAMVARHAYKEPSSPFDVLQEFSESRFSDLDLEIVDVFLKNMPQELTGKRVTLSDGRIGTVVYTNPSNFAYPIVRVGKNLIATNPSLKCMMMSNYISLF